MSAKASTVELADGSQATVKLLDLQESRDSIRNAVRRAVVTVEVDGQRAELVAAMYNLPQTVGKVQIDCPVTRGYQSNAHRDGIWNLARDARLRLWPAGSPLLAPGTFVYPARERWFASDTHMANDPCYVDGGERPDVRQIYYHYGLDIGGSEGMVDVVAATAGLVVSVGDAVLPGHEKNTPVEPRYDVVYLLDDRGWYYRYSHLQSIDASIKPGRSVSLGQKIGVLGKEGGSGGWSHLHFDIFSRSRRVSGASRRATAFSGKRTGASLIRRCWLWPGRITWQPWAKRCGWTARAAGPGRAAWPPTAGLCTTAAGPKARWSSAATSGPARIARSWRSPTRPAARISTSRWCKSSIRSSPTTCPLRSTPTTPRRSASAPATR